MNNAKKQMVDALLYGIDPFVNFPVNDHPADHQGWNSDHEYLSKSLKEVNPRVIVEVGVWKGGSVKTMAQAARNLDLDCVIIAIDTWLGSAEHWENQNFYHDLRVLNGFPRLYHTFISNILDSNTQDFVVPLPIDSINALHLLKRKGIRPNILHIDAGHDYHSVASDLNNWWPVLSPGGILIGDDYYTDGIHWPEVRKAVDDFFAINPHFDFEHQGGKCIARKPLVGSHDR